MLFRSSERMMRWMPLSSRAIGGGTGVCAGATAISRSSMQTRMPEDITPRLSCRVRTLDLAQAPLQEPGLALIRDQRQRAAVRFRGFRPGAQPAQEVGAGGVQQVVVLQVSGSG